MKAQTLNLAGMNLSEMSYEEQATKNGGAWFIPVIIAVGVFVANKSYDQGHRDGQGSYCPAPKRRK